MSSKVAVFVDPGIIARYPQDLLLDDGTSLTVTPMVASDWQLLERYLCEIPREERRFLREDVSDPGIVQRWCSELDYQHIVPLLAWEGERIAADAALELEPGLWTAHVGKVRLFVHPEYRGRGIATRMLGHLIELARESGLHKVVFECAGGQAELIALLQRQRFHEQARLPQFVRDRESRFHDLVLMVHDLH